MALFKQIKRAFGFSDAELEEEELEGIDARVTPLRRRAEDGVPAGSERMPHAYASERQAAPQVVPAKPVNSDEMMAVSGDDDAKLVPSDIFESVVKLFNESLPAFVRESVDEKAQREYIYKALDESMRHYIENLGTDARRRCDIQWEAERKDLMMQMESLRSKAQKDEEECGESKKLQLSAERQKRALSERVHELEKQMASIEAENEQYVLENKSLVNKLRLHSVMNSSEGGEMQEELSAKIVELNDSLSVSQKNLATLQTENEKLREALEKAKAKDDLGEAMVSEFNSRLATAKEECKTVQTRLSDIQKENDSLQDALKAARKENADLVNTYGKLKAEHTVTESRLNEAMENLAVVEDMHKQLSVLEDARRSNEAVLHKLKDEIAKKDERLKQAELEKNDYASVLKKKDETIMSLEELSDGLRKTIETNLYEHAQTLSAMRAEIDRLKHLQRAGSNGAVEVAEVANRFDVPEGEMSDADNSKTQKNRGNKRMRTKISAIDESIEDTDWLIATPPPAKKRDSRDDASEDFGYKEPVKKNTPDNPAQMSLW